MPTEKFLISELAELAGTTIRTIRYYTDEGLLPQPEIQGRYAYYDLNHLNRLELIRRMKVAYLPLREIQQIMLSMTDDEVTKQLAEGLPSGEKIVAEPDPPAYTPNSGSNALEYISRLMQDQQVLRPQEPPAPARASQPVKIERQQRIFPSISRDEPPAEHWQRISLAAGVELHLRIPADPEFASRVQQLLAFANKLFRQT